ncbi:MAG TPA: hypothetical protein VN083_08895 [Vicinamibacteria bacterium]|jgi:hypothetical protein|nr:hypothetical protein [Vicinamibacteria bacterium]
MTRGVPVFLALALAALPLLAEGTPKPKKPHLDLRASPRMALSPVTIHLTAEIVGGDDIEEWYCPEIEWNWDDGGKSVQESDCPPFGPDTKIERRFSATHDYPRAGVYNIKISLRHKSQTLAAQTVRITIRPGVSDMSNEEQN